MQGICNAEIINIGHVQGMCNAEIINIWACAGHSQCRNYKYLGMCRAFAMQRNQLEVLI